MENTLGTKLMHREALIRLHLTLLAWSKNQHTERGKKRKLEDVGDNSKHSKQQKLDGSGNFEPFIHKLLTEDQICRESAQRAR